VDRTPMGNQLPVTQATGGGKLHVKVQETIYHPGFYRRRARGELADRAAAGSKATTAERARTQSVWARS